MSQQAADTQYQLKLKEGDLIRGTITSVGENGVKVDLSEWANVDTAEFVDVVSAPSPGREIYARVTDVNTATVTLTQERGVYNRNHLPGDLVRVLGVEALSTNLCRAVTDDMRNLESIYVVGMALGTNATVELKKVRGGVAVAFPEEIHRHGITPGQPVTIKTTAGTHEAVLVDLNGENDQATLSQLDIQIRLSTPACVTGTAQAYVTDLDENTVVVEIDSYPADLPNPRQTVESTVREGHSSTTVPIEHTDVEILAELDNPAPLTGTGLIELGHREDGAYQAELLEYTVPPISAGETFDGLVYASQNTGRIQCDDKEFSVTLTTDISTSGKATMKITTITDHVKAEVVDEIQPISTEDTETTDVDLTNLSKL